MILSYIHLDGWATALTSWLILKETESKGRRAPKTDISGGAILKNKKKKQVSSVEMSLKEQFKCRSFSLFRVSTERSRAAPNKNLRMAESLDLSDTDGVGSDQIIRPAQVKSSLTSFPFLNITFHSMQM